MEKDSLIHDDFTNRIFGMESYFRVGLRTILDDKTRLSTIREFLTKNSVSWELIEMRDTSGDWFVRFIGQSLGEVFRTLPTINTIIDAAWITFYDLDPISTRGGLPLMKEKIEDNTYVLLISPSGELFTMPSDYVWMRPYTFSNLKHSGSSAGGYSMYQGAVGVSSSHKPNKAQSWVEEKKKKDQLRSKIIAQENKNITRKGSFKNYGLNRR